MSYPLQNSLRLQGQGVFLLPAKGFSPAGNNVVIDTARREVNLRGKLIPFSEVDSIGAQTTPVIGRNMTMLLLVQKGKKKMLVPGAIVSKDLAALEAFVKELNGMVK